MYSFRFSLYKCVSYDEKCIFMNVLHLFRLNVAEPNQTVLVQLFLSLVHLVLSLVHPVPFLVQLSLLQIFSFFYASLCCSVLFWTKPIKRLPFLLCMAMYGNTWNYSLRLESAISQLLVIKITLSSSFKLLLLQMNIFQVWNIRSSFLSCCV